jgi:hypothetical protein
MSLRELTGEQEFDRICDFDNGEADNPESPADGVKYSEATIRRSKMASKL